LCGGAPVADASSSDAEATHAYLLAQYRLITALVHDSAAPRAAETAAAAQIARECPGVVSGMPKEVAPGPGAATPPRVKGEQARLRQQKETLEKELDAGVERAGDSAFLPAEEAYDAEVRPLSWSNPAISAAVDAVVTLGLQARSAAVPAFCPDARAWAQSDYRVLSASSREFQAEETRTSERLTEASLATLLKPYEDAPDRELIRKTHAAETGNASPGDEDSLRTLLSLDRTVGFSTPKQPARIKLGRGRTAAGTRFEVTSESGGLSSLAGAGCHRSATVAYGRPNAPETQIVGGPNNPICLSSPAYRHPALFCEVGIETIQTAVPASVRSVRLVLANGRTIESRVLRVSRRDGGPAGIYAQEIRGTRSHAVSLDELDAAGGAVLSLRLPPYRCIKPREEPEEEPTVTDLANGRTPEGEAFVISTLGTLGGNFNGEPFIDVRAGVDPELDLVTDAFGPTKAFAWSLRIGCAPHPYAILYGILAPPGESAEAQTPEGPAALNVVPLEARLHAKGPLAYGVFTALPSELTVLGASGATVYRENLQQEDTEVAEFCEGYAEP
jgi:hypothetical protein